VKKGVCTLTRKHTRNDDTYLKTYSYNVTDSNFGEEGSSMSQNFSPHENYRGEELTEYGSDRAFGCTVGTILMVIGTAKIFVAVAISWVVCLIFTAGALLFLLGIVAPSRLSVLTAGGRK
jgi:hypothetical protein